MTQKFLIITILIILSKICYSNILDFSNEIKYFVFSDSLGLWLKINDKQPEILYKQSTNWEITSISIDNNNDIVYFTEKCRDGEWFYSNAKAIYIKFEGDNIYRSNPVNIISTANNHYLSLQECTNIYPSSNGQYIVVQLKWCEDGWLFLYKRDKYNYYETKIFYGSYIYDFMSWDEGSKEFYFMQNEMEFVNGLYIFNVDSLKKRFICKEDIMSISPRYNLSLTIPYSLRYMFDVSVKLLKLDNCNLIKEYKQKFAGRPKYKHIKWNPVNNEVMILLNDMEGILISSEEKKHINFHKKINSYIWSKDGEKIYFSSKDKIYFTSRFSYEPHVFYKNENNKQINMFRIIWK